jgi:hypothetical protein
VFFLDSVAKAVSALKYGTESEAHASYITLNNSKTYMEIFCQGNTTIFLEKQPTHALNCTTLLFNIQAPICFSSGLPSSGSFLDSFELLEMQIE